jgi:lambda family phage portal protein
MSIFNFWRKEPDKKSSLKRTKTRTFKSAASSNLAHGWTTQTTKPDADIRNGLRQLRARSREQYQNNDVAHKFINMVKDNVVGSTGITMQARTTFLETGKLDDIANKVLEAAWKDWSKSKNCDITGTRSFKAIQKLFISSVALDGEAIVQKIYDGKYRFKLDLIDPELLNIEYNRNSMPNGSYIRMGIEFNKNGAPVAYHFTNDRKTSDWYSYQGTDYRRVSAKHIIHKFSVEYVGQTRGVPWMSTAMLRMKMLDGYEEAAVFAARLGAAKGGFFTSETGEEFVGDDVDASGNIIDEVEAGVLTELPKGTSFTPYDPTYPHQQFPEFMKSALRRISAGLGVSYNSLGNDLESVNYSSMRSGLLEERESWKAIQEWMIDEFMVDVYESWLRQSLLNQNIKIGKAVLNPLREEKYQKVSFQAKRWSWVDPKKDVEAAIMAVDNGFRSRSDVIRESGRDPEEVFSEIASENLRLKELGVELNAQEMIESPLDAQDVTEALETQ